MIQPEPSYSPLTVFDIRYHTDLSLHESNAQSIARLATKYDLPLVDVKLLIAADDEHIDARGRSKP